MAAAGSMTAHGGTPVPAAATAILERWLARCAAALAGPPRRRAAIVEELRDGLHEATSARLARGMSAPDAARAALTEFGDPLAVAAAFAAELAAARARAMTGALVGSGPLVGLTWIAALLTSHGGMRVLVSARAAWPLLPIVVGAVVLAAVLVTLATGRLSRWVPARPGLVLGTAAAAGLATVTLDLSVLGLLAFKALTAGWAPLAGPLLPLAVTASVTRLTMATRAAHGCLTDARSVTWAGT